jgi:hypothetical protein
MTNPAAGVAANGLWVENERGVDEDSPAHALPEGFVRSSTNTEAHGTATTEVGAQGPATPRPETSPENSGSKVPELEPDTPMQKVVLPGLVELTLGNVVVPGRFDPYRIAGFVTRLQDAPAGSAMDLARRYGLDQVPGWPLTSELYVLRFYAHSTEPYIAPFERNVYQMDLLELPAGAELWRIDAAGGEQRVGAYLNRQVGWVSTAPIPLGPGRWNQPPVPLQPSVRRGLVAVFRGQDYDADFGPRPGEVTLHPLPGSEPPKEFAEQAGTYTLTVTISDLDSLELVRWCGGWRGLPVELVESGPQRVVVHYIGENGQRAADFGLAEVDYRVWRGYIPPTELVGVEERRVRLAIG